jgi:hypothetical protein
MKQEENEDTPNSELEPDLIQLRANNVQPWLFFHEKGANEVDHRRRGGVEDAYQP